MSLPCMIVPESLEAQSTASGFGEASILLMHIYVKSKSTRSVIPKVSLVQAGSGWRTGCFF